MCDYTHPKTNCNANAKKQSRHGNMLTQSPCKVGLFMGPRIENQHRRQTTILMRRRTSMKHEPAKDLEKRMACRSERWRSCTKHELAPSGAGRRCMRDRRANGHNLPRSMLVALDSPPRLRSARVQETWGGAQAPMFLVVVTNAFPTARLPTRE